MFELGCGNGSVAHALTKLGYDVVGVDPSAEGILQANKSFPNLQLFLGNAYDLASIYGTFPIAISLEVVEHIFFPRQYIATLFDSLQPGGILIISTPYHGYLINFALSVTGKMDKHFTVLWDYGHIKFWSVKSLSFLLRKRGIIHQ